MQIHTLQPKTRRKNKKIIGRGGKRGTYSGRGIKGQRARAGRKIRPEFRDTLKAIPKRRGVKMPAVVKYHVATVNVGTLARLFPKGTVVTPRLLVEKRVVRRRLGRVPRVKILGDGNVPHALIISGCAVSLQAGEKIIKVEGKIE